MSVHREMNCQKNASFVYIYTESEKNLNLFVIKISSNLVKWERLIVEWKVADSYSLQIRTPGTRRPLLHASSQRKIKKIHVQLVKHSCQLPWVPFRACLNDWRCWRDFFRPRSLSDVTVQCHRQLAAFQNRHLFLTTEVEKTIIVLNSSTYNFAKHYDYF